MRGVGESIDVTERKKAMDTFIKTYAAQACNVSQACKKANISRLTYYNWLKEYPFFKREVQESRESLIDFAESKLMVEVKSGNITAIALFLNAQAKHRGYGK